MGAANWSVIGQSSYLIGLSRLEMILFVYQCPFEMPFGVFLNGDVVSTVDLYKTHLTDTYTFHKALIGWGTLGL